MLRSYVKQNKKGFQLLLSFIFGASLTAFYLYHKRDVAENSYFKGLAETILEQRKGYNEDSLIVDAMHMTHALLQPRNIIFGNPSQTANVSYDGSLTGDLITASGACGSYANVLCRLLQTMNFRARIGQMKVRNEFGGHIITEVLVGYKWVVLDASYDLCFVNPRGQLASFSEIRDHWADYQKVLPPEYNPDYRYEEIRYANWTKIPVIMPALKRSLAFFSPKTSVNEISIRPYFIRKYQIYSIIAGFINVVTLIFSLKGYAPLFHLRFNSVDLSEYELPVELPK
jgi:hypothetical protein